MQQGTLPSKHKERKRVRDHADVELEAELTKKLFGDSKLLNLFGKEPHESEGAEVEAEAALEGEGDEANLEAAEPQSVETNKQDQVQEPSAAVWHDPDDDNITVDLRSAARLRKLRKAPEDPLQKQPEEILTGTTYVERLRTQFQKLNRNVDWAKIRTDENEDTETFAALQSTKSLVQRSSSALPANNIDILRVKDANAAAPAKSTIHALHFHPSGQLMLTGGFDKTLRLFQVDGKANLLTQSVFFEDLPIASAFFSADGSEVVCTGRRQYFYFYDLQAGRIHKVAHIKGCPDRSLETAISSPDNKYLAVLGDNGIVYLLSNRTKQQVWNLKQNGSVRCAAFSKDGQRLYTAGGDARVYIWDLATRRCANVFIDEGAVHTTSMSLSADDTLLACGSNSGVVNVYGTEKLTENTAPKPLKAVMNLTTSIKSLQFNCDSQVLCFASNEAKDSLRLFHLPSRSVFSNWPTTRTPLHYVQQVAFSPNSGYLAVGNDKGKVLLYRLNHYLQS